MKLATNGVGDKMVLQKNPQLRPEQLGEGGAEQRETDRLPDSAGRL